MIRCAAPARPATVMGRRPPRSAARVALLAAGLAALGAAGCAGTRPPPALPAARPGWVRYELVDLRVEAPAAWAASGGARRLALEAPGGRARLEVSVPETSFASERACLAAADEKLGAQQAGLERARRHPTRFAGRPAQVLEADRGGWHVWAIAACDGGVQYRIFFTAATPAAPDALEAWRTLVDSARIGGEA